MQKVAFRVAHRHTKRRGVTESYDFVSKKLYVKWEGELVAVAVPIHKLTMKENLVEDEYGAQEILFKSIADRVDALMHMLAKKNAEAVVSSLLSNGTLRVCRFVANWQEETWERLVSEVTLEMALEEAEEDMSEAIAEHERKLEEERQRRLAEERRKEEEKQRALRFKKMVTGVATKNVNKLLR